MGDNDTGGWIKNEKEIKRMNEGRRKERLRKRGRGKGRIKGVDTTKMIMTQKQITKNWRDVKARMK